MSSRAKLTSAPAASRLARTAATAIAAAVLAGCGSDGAPEAASEPRGRDEVIDISGTEAVGEMTGGSVAQLVECRDWNGASAEQRLATIEDVRSQVSREDSGLDTPALTDEEATRVFESACEPAWAQGFRLYKLYARAAGFVPLQRAIEGD